MSSTSLPVTKDELSVLLSNPLPAHTHAPTHTHIHTLDSIPSHLYMAITSTIPPSLMDHFHQHTNTSYNFSILKRSRDSTSLSRVILFLYCPLRNISLDSLVPSPLLPFPLEFHLFPKTPLTKVTLHSQVDLGSPLTPSQSFPPPWAHLVFLLTHWSLFLSLLCWLTWRNPRFIYGPLLFHT